MKESNNSSLNYINNLFWTLLFAALFIFSFFCLVMAIRSIKLDDLVINLDVKIGILASFAVFLLSYCIIYNKQPNFISKDVVAMLNSKNLNTLMVNSMLIKGYKKSMGDQSSNKKGNSSLRRDTNLIRGLEHHHGGSAIDQEREYNNRDENFQYETDEFGNEQYEVPEYDYEVEKGDSIETSIVAASGSEDNIIDYYDKNYDDKNQDNDDIQAEVRANEISMDYMKDSHPSVKKEFEEFDAPEIALMRPQPLNRSRSREEDSMEEWDFTPTDKSRNHFEPESEEDEFPEVDEEIGDPEVDEEIGDPEVDEEIGDPEVDEEIGDTEVDVLDELEAELEDLFEEGLVDTEFQEDEQIQDEMIENRIAPHGDLVDSYEMGSMQESLPGVLPIPRKPDVLQEHLRSGIRPPLSVEEQDLVILNADNSTFQRLYDLSDAHFGMIASNIEYGVQSEQLSNRIKDEFIQDYFKTYSGALFILNINSIETDNTKPFVIFSNAGDVLKGIALDGNDNVYVPYAPYVKMFDDFFIKSKLTNVFDSEIDIYFDTVPKTFPLSYTILIQECLNQFDPRKVGTLILLNIIASKNIPETYLHSMIHTLTGGEHDA